MQRRNFLRGLLGIAATAAAAPLMKYLPAPAAPKLYSTYIIGENAVLSSTSATIAQYADYVSLSDLALESAIDPALENCAKELSYRIRFTLGNIYDLRTAPYVIRKQYIDLDSINRERRQMAIVNREVRKERYLAKQRRRSARMAA